MNWNELIENAIHGFPADDHYTALLSAILEVEKERDNLKTVLHGNQDADYDKQLQIETLEKERNALKESVRWIPVDERLPEAKQDVLILVRNNKIRIEKACYIPPRTVLSEDFLSDEFDCESAEAYDAENDCYWVVEGWWESSWESEANWKISGEVTHWMPLPAVPERDVK